MPTPRPLFTEEFYVAIVAVLVAYGGFMTWLHYREIADFDKCHPTVTLEGPQLA